MQTLLLSHCPLQQKNRILQSSLQVMKAGAVGEWERHRIVARWPVYNNSTRAAAWTVGWSIPYHPPGDRPTQVTMQTHSHTTHEDLVGVFSTLLRQNKEMKSTNVCLKFCKKNIAHPVTIQLKSSHKCDKVQQPPFSLHPPPTPTCDQRSTWLCSPRVPAQHNLLLLSGLSHEHWNKKSTSA